MRSARFLLLIPFAPFVLGAGMAASAADAPKEQPMTEAPSAIVTQEPSLGASFDINELKKLRDPFKRPPAEIRKEEGPKSDLELIPTESFKMVGVLTGPHRIRAILVSPDGKTHMVAESMKIGQRGGVIRKIYEDRVTVREKQVDVLGESENVDIDIPLQTQTKGGVPAGRVAGR